MNRLLLICLTALSALSISVAANELNGFDLESETLDSRFVLKVGEPGNAQVIPNAADHISASEAEWQDDDFVLGIVIDNQAHAYSLASLTHDPIVNDTVNGIPVLVNFCILCGSGTVYDRGVQDTTMTFADSGLVYRADVLFYDKETRSLWSPFLNASVSGASEGKELALIPSKMTYWAEWKKTHPTTTVSVRPVSHDFPGDEHLHIDGGVPLHHGYHPKTPTLGLSWPDGDAVAFTASEVLEAGGKVSETIDGTAFSVSFDSTSQEFIVDTKLKLKVFRGTWSNWQKEHPEGRWYTYSAGEEEKS